MVVKMPFPKRSDRKTNLLSRRRWLILYALLVFFLGALGAILILIESSQAQTADLVSATPPAPTREISATSASSANSEALSAATGSAESALAQAAAVPTLPMQSDATPPAVPSRIPIYRSTDFLGGYMSNLTSPIIVDGKPWDNSSVDILRLKEPGGGTSYWDYWSDPQDWGIANHQWRDDQGNWHPYTTRTITDISGRTVTAYVLVDREGPGVMDRLWFTNDAVTSISSITNPLNPSELTEWGNLSKLGKLRIQVDDQIVYDGPIETWFSGEAQGLPQTLRDLLMWHYRQFGANGNIIPIPYQKHIQVSLYGGEKKPKWFMATGMTLPAGTRVESYSLQDLSLENLGELARNVTRPEDFINTQPNTHYARTAQAGAPASVAFQGAGTLAAMQLRIGKAYDPKNLSLTVRYGTVVGIDMPLLAFFTEPGHLVYHRSTPIGVIDMGDSNLFYSNLPMPFRDGISLQISTTSPRPVPIDLQVSTLETVFNTQLRALYTPFQKLQMYGPDYMVHLDGSGKLVGLVFDSQDQHYDLVPHIRTKDPNKDDIDKIVFDMGYLEGNLTMTDGAGNSRYYSGQEDWAEGGYYFNLGYTTPSGGANRPFAGFFRYRSGANGYASFFRYFNDLAAFRFENGLDLAFGHGTYRNNFPVSYSTVAFYYVEISGLEPVSLPASDYLLAPSPTLWNPK